MTAPIRNKMYWTRAGGFIPSLPDHFLQYKVVTIWREDQYVDLLFKELHVPLRSKNRDYYYLFGEYPDTDHGPDGVFFSADGHVLFMEAKRGSSSVASAALYSGLIQWEKLLAQPFAKVSAGFNKYCRQRHGKSLCARFRSVSGRELGLPASPAHEQYPPAEAGFAVAIVSRDLRKVPAGTSLRELVDRPIVPVRLLTVPQECVGRQVETIGYQVYENPDSPDDVVVEIEQHSWPAVETISSPLFAPGPTPPEPAFIANPSEGLLSCGLAGHLRDTYLFLRNLRPDTKLILGSKAGHFVGFESNRGYFTLTASDGAIELRVHAECLMEFGIERVRNIAEGTLGKEHSFCASLGNAELPEYVPLADIRTASEAEAELPQCREFLAKLVSR